MCNTCLTQNRTKIVASNPLRADPTRTSQLRLRFEQLLRGKFNRLKTALLKLIVEEDAFGIKRKTPVVKNEEREDDAHKRNRVVLYVRPENSKKGNIPSVSWDLSTGNNYQQGQLRLEPTTMDFEKTQVLPELSNIHPPTTNVRRWQFQTTSEQVTSFEKWIKGQVDKGVLDGKTSETGSEGYWRTFTNDGYRRGAGRAFNDVRKPALSTGKSVSDFFDGTRDEFLRQSFGRPVAIDKLKLLAGRVFTDLQGITTAMSTQLSRQLVDGLARGAGPATIAKELIETIDGIGARRATLLARTEIIRDHAEGQLDAFESLGVTELGVMAEWSTAGDDRVCPLCEALEGVVMTVKEARGLIPRHTLCRCAFIPSNVGESTKGQVRGQKSIQRAMDDSISAEIPRGRILKGGARRFQNPVTGQGPFTFRTKRTLAQQKARSSWVGADRTIAKRRPTPSVPPQGKPPTKPKKKPIPKPQFQPTVDFSPDISFREMQLLKDAQDKSQERMLFIRDGKVISRVDGVGSEVRLPQEMQTQLKNSKGDIVTLHNHPSLSPPSPNDIGMYAGSGGNHFAVDDDFVYHVFFDKKRSLRESQLLRREWDLDGVTINTRMQIWEANQVRSGKKVTALARERQFAQLSHESLERFSKKHGFEYSRIDFEGFPAAAKPKAIVKLPRQEDITSFSTKLKRLKPGTERTIPPTNLLGEPGFDRLIVGTERLRDGLTVTQRIVVFDVEATTAGQGAFTRSIAELKKQGLPIRMDNVTTEQFKKGLERLGFRRSDQSSMIWDPPGVVTPKPIVPKPTSKPSAKLKPAGQAGDNRTLQKSRITQELRDGENGLAQVLEESEEIADGVVRYTNEGHTPLNQALREGKKLSASELQMQESLDTLMLEYDTPFVTYRGIQSNGQSWIDLAEDILNSGTGRIQDKAFVSTSLTPRQAASFTEAGVEERVLLQISSRDGAYVGKSSSTLWENEMVLPRNSEFRVLGIDRNVSLRTIRPGSIDSLGDIKRFSVIRLEVIEKPLPPIVPKPLAPKSSVVKKKPVTKPSQRKIPKKKQPGVSKPSATKKKPVTKPSQRKVPKKKAPTRQPKPFPGGSGDNRSLVHISRDNVNPVLQRQGEINRSIVSAKPSMQNSIDEYSESSFKMNTRLRKGEKLTKAQEDITRDLDSLMENLDEPVAVFRGVGNEGDDWIALAQNSLNENSVIMDRAFVSTSASPMIAETFVSPSSRVMLQISTKRGVYIEPITGSLGTGELEFILPRNTQYRVIDIDRNVVITTNEREKIKHTIIRLETIDG